MQRYQTYHKTCNLPSTTGSDPHLCFYVARLVPDALPCTFILLPFNIQLLGSVQTNNSTINSSRKCNNKDALQLKRFTDETTINNTITLDDRCYHRQKENIRRRHYRYYSNGMGKLENGSVADFGRVLLFFYKLLVYETRKREYFCRISTLLDNTQRKNHIGTIEEPNFQEVLICQV